LMILPPDADQVNRNTAKKMLKNISIIAQKPYDSFIYQSKH